MRNFQVSFKILLGFVFSFCLTETLGMKTPVGVPFEDTLPFQALKSKEINIQNSAPLGDDGSLTDTDTSIVVDLQDGTSTTLSDGQSLTDIDTGNDTLPPLLDSKFLEQNSLSKPKTEHCVDDFIVPKKPMDDGLPPLVPENIISADAAKRKVKRKAQDRARREAQRKAEAIAKREAKKWRAEIDAGKKKIEISKPKRVSHDENSKKDILDSLPPPIFESEITCITLIFFIFNTIHNKI